MDSQPKDYLCLQAWMHLRYGRVTEAVVILEGLTVLIPGDAWVHRTLGYAYLQVGEDKIADVIPADLKPEAFNGAGPQARIEIRLDPLLLLHLVIEEQAEAMGGDLRGLGRIHFIEFVSFHRAPIEQFGIDDVSGPDVLHKSLQASQIVHCRRR